MYLIVIYYPLVSSLICFILGRHLGKYGATNITLLCMIMAAISSFVLFKDVVIDKQIVEVPLFEFLNVFDIHVDFTIVFDTLTCIMLMIVLVISCLVHVFSIEYMQKDPHLIRFLGFLSLFTFFMVLLVVGGNYIILFIGWEGIGLCSYFLINFWHTRIAANKAAMKALIINKVGDVAFVLATIFLFRLYATWDFGVINCTSWLIQKSVYINTYIFWMNIDYITIILFLLIIGVCAKSAQIGLHTWLPDAMEGPTPVSALIHAATMVTAGVFLLLRSTYLLKYDYNSLLLISFLGGITSFIAATIGLFQNDIKKIIAYSTCSQLGYMVLSCGLNNYSGSLFHLMNHAFFKALLFLSAGAIIHSMLDQQDVRRMGMLLKYLPISYIMILIGSLTIMGIPFLTGFYSKDFILEYIYSSNIFLNFFLYWLGIISAALTSFYSIKLLFLTFYNVHNSYFNILYNKKKKKVSIHESKFLILLALIILFFGSIFVGYLFKDLFIGMGTDVWTNTLDTESYKNNLKIFEVEFLPIKIKLIPIIFTFVSALSSYIFFKFYIFVIEYIYILYFYLNKDIKFKKYIKLIFIIKKLIFNGYYFNEIYNYYLFRNKKLSFNLMKNLDRGIIEYLGHLFIVNNIKKILYLFSKKYPNRIDYLVFTMIVGIILIFFFFLTNFLIIYKILFMLFILIFFEIKN